MANDCTFELKVKGKASNIETLFDWLSAQYLYRDDGNSRCWTRRKGKNHGVEHHIGYRVFDFYNSYPFGDGGEDWYTDSGITPDSVIVAEGSGTCAWSVVTCMFPDGYMHDQQGEFAISITDAAKKLNLEIEIFSYEPGCEFSEHFHIKPDGDYTEDVHDYDEYWIGQWDTYEDLVEDEPSLAVLISKDLYLDTKAAGNEDIAFCDFWSVPNGYDWPWEISLLRR